MTIAQRANSLLATLVHQKEIFTEIDRDRFLSEANAADLRHSRGSFLSSLDGEFLAIKANIDVKGLRSHAGSKLFRPPIATCDAPVVERLRAAGLIVVGHTNMSEFAFSGLGLNPHFGTPSNVLNTQLVPGGSSSGSATAVAKGLVDVALGTDTSGSVRIPAACQGIVGFRPSIGRYEFKGTYPLAPSLDTLGTLARTIEQIQSLDHLITGENTSGQCCNRIICLNDNALATFAPSMRELYQNAIKLLNNSKFKLEFKSIESFERIDDLFRNQGTLVGAEAYRQLHKIVENRDTILDPRVHERLAASAMISDTHLRALLSEKKVISEIYKTEMKNGMLLYPTLLCPPPSLEKVMRGPDEFACENAQILSLPMKAAFLDAPTIAFPVEHKTAGASLSLTAIQGNDTDLLVTARSLKAIF